MSTRATMAVLAVLGSAAVASAAVSSTIVTVEMSATVNGETYTRTRQWTTDTSQWGDQGGWNAKLPTDGEVIYALDDLGAVVLDENNQPVVLGTIRGCGFSYITDPQIALNFSVQAGLVDTAFTISSAVLAFPDPNQNTGYASAGITVTGNGNGASLSEVDPNGIYRATFNGSNVFTYLHDLPPLGALTTGPNSSTSYPDSFGYAPLGTDANNISSRFQFLLTAGDQASGTSVFIVVPTPASAFCLGLSGLLAARRRR